jgi:MoxR-like ATPase
MSISPILVHDAADEADIRRAVERAKAAAVAYNSASVAQLDAPSKFSIPHDADLIGIDDTVYRQIETALNAGKDHLMLYGPPGTGKTELARYVATRIAATPYVLVTGSADWSSQDLIGGYQPIGGGEIAFVPGILLRNLDRPFIIDELNRCDIDKVLGPLFTVLSKKATTLPYRVDVADRESAQYRILGEYQAQRDETDFAPEPSWRIIATINTVDKASLYQLSYALSRRFAWVFVDVPADLPDFVRRFVTRHGSELTAADPPLARIWKAVNDVRPLGAAPFIDIILYCLTAFEDFDFGADPSSDKAPNTPYLDAIKVFVAPMLDGCLRDELQRLADIVSEILHLDATTRHAFTRQMTSIGL